MRALSHSDSKGEHSLNACAGDRPTIVSIRINVCFLGCGGGQVVFGEEAQRIIIHVVSFSCLVCSVSVRWTHSHVRTAHTACIRAGPAFATDRSIDRPMRIIFGPAHRYACSRAENVRLDGSYRECSIRSIGQRLLAGGAFSIARHGRVNGR